MRNFSSAPEPGGARGDAHTSAQDIPQHVMKVYPGGASIARATPDVSEPTGPGEYTYRQPVKSVRHARVARAGRP